MLAVLALLGLGALRRVDRNEAVGTGVRGIAPARRRLASPLARGLAGLFGWLLAALLLLPHMVLMLVSLVPAVHLDGRALPARAQPGELDGPRSPTPSACAPSSTRSGWPPPPPLAALALGLAAARLAVARRDRVAAACSKG